MPETKRALLVLRHAHSSWAIAGQRDHLRDLDERGRRQAKGLARFASEGALPVIATILCSTATRARQTLEPILAAGPTLPEPVFSDDLYARGIDAYFEAVNRTGDQEGAILIVGHNPMIEEFTLALVRDDEKAAATLRTGFPTAAMALLRLRGASFSEVGPGGARLERMIDPEGRF